MTTEARQKLFDYFKQDHNVILHPSEIDEVENIFLSERGNQDYVISQKIIDKYDTDESSYKSKCIADGVRILRVCLNPGGYVGGWNTEREYIFTYLMRTETRQFQKQGIKEFADDLRKSPRKESLCVNTKMIFHIK